jgi:DNA-binding NtrC family response regulator
MTDHEKPKVVLLVEDEALLRMFADEVLTELGGFKVIPTSSADEAISILYVRSDVRVLFTDVDMPGSMDGVALAHSVRAQWPEVAIVVTSGVGATAPLPSGARSIQKPYGATQLVALIQEMLSSSAVTASTPQPGREVEETPARAVLPMLNLGGLHMGNGTSGGLAQPLPEPDE